MLAIWYLIISSRPSILQGSYTLFVFASAESRFNHTFHANVLQWSTVDIAEKPQTFGSKDFISQSLFISFDYGESKD
jgi:hypothetical protein